MHVYEFLHKNHIKTTTKIIIPKNHNTKPHPQKCKTVEKPQTSKNSKAWTTTSRKPNNKNCSLKAVRLSTVDIT